MERVFSALMGQMTVWNFPVVLFPVSLFKRTANNQAVVESGTGTSGMGWEWELFGHPQPYSTMDTSFNRSAGRCVWIRLFMVLVPILVE